MKEVGVGVGVGHQRLKGQFHKTEESVLAQYSFVYLPHTPVVVFAFSVFLSIFHFWLWRRYQYSFCLFLCSPICIQCNIVLMTMLWWLRTLICTQCNHVVVAAYSYLYSV